MHIEFSSITRYLPVIIYFSIDASGTYLRSTLLIVRPCEIRAEVKVGKENHLDYFYLIVSMFILESSGGMEWHQCRLEVVNERTE